MAKKFRNKYRIASARAQWWDYGNNGAYFVTICTHNRLHFFGEIANGQMTLSKPGKLADTHWHEIPDRFPYAHLGEFIIMPNHIHGIIIIDHTNDGDDSDGVGDGAATRLIASLPSPNPGPPKSKSPNPPGGITGNKNPMLHKNLSRIIRWYKGRITFEARKTNPNFEWQTRFHDNIIRDKRAYDNITNYIRNNPGNWPSDKQNR